jgi:hypothetical protein
MVLMYAQTIAYPQQLTFIEHERPDIVILFYGVFIYLVLIRSLYYDYFHFTNGKTEVIRGKYFANHE